MQRSRLRGVVARAALVLPVLLLVAGVTPLAQAGRDHRQILYRVTILPSLGGTASAGSSINNRGWVAGFSNLAGDRTRHATLWHHQRIVDLGTLGGPNSSVAWPVVLR